MCQRCLNCMHRRTHTFKCLVFVHVRSPFTAKSCWASAYCPSKRLDNRIKFVPTANHCCNRTRTRIRNSLSFLADALNERLMHRHGPRHTTILRSACNEVDGGRYIYHRDYQIEKSTTNSEPFFSCFALVRSLGFGLKREHDFATVAQVNCHQMKTDVRLLRIVSFAQQPPLAVGRCVRVCGGVAF